MLIIYFFLFCSFLTDSVKVPVDKNELGQYSIVAVSQNKVLIFSNVEEDLFVADFNKNKLETLSFDETIQSVCRGQNGDFFVLLYLQNKVFQYDKYLDLKNEYIINSESNTYDKLVYSSQNRLLLFDSNNTTVSVLNLFDHKLLINEDMRIRTSILFNEHSRFRFFGEDLLLIGVNKSAMFNPLGFYIGEITNISKDFSKTGENIVWLDNYSLIANNRNIASEILTFDTFQKYVFSLNKSGKLVRY